VNEKEMRGDGSTNVGLGYACKALVRKTGRIYNMNARIILKWIWKGM
jgi:hypothetical protein